MKRVHLLGLVASCLPLGAACTPDWDIARVLEAAGSGSGGNGAGGSSGSGAGATGSNHGPIILAFSAAPPNVPAGGGQTTLNFRIEDADTLSIAPGVGDVAGTSASVKVSEPTLFTLTATNAYGRATATAAVTVGRHPSRHAGRFAAMIAPTVAESFVAPATLRLIAAGYDPQIPTNTPTEGHGSNAQTVEFFVDENAVLTVSGAQAEFQVFKGFASGIPRGQHTVWARAHFSAVGSVAAEVLDSEPTVITVDDAPAYGRTVDLTSDVIVSGAKGYALQGSASSRVRLDGHGHSIKSSGSTSAALTLQFVDVFDLGSETETSKPSIDVSTSGKVTIENAHFDTTNPVYLTLDGSAEASIRQNLFRSNMRMPLGQDMGQGPGSSPVAHFGGTSDAAKVFAGNNVAAGWVEFENARRWTVGGDADADENVLIGPRVGFRIENSKEMRVRRNYSHHVYEGGWDDATNVELWGTSESTIEHNVVVGASWCVRGVGSELRYNLVSLFGAQEAIDVSPHGWVHHNVIVGAGSDTVAGVYVLNDPPVGAPASLRVTNNTLDGQHGADMKTGVLLDATAGPVTLESNAFLNIPTGPTVGIGGGPLMADYNGFFASAKAHYSDGRTPSHDVVGANADLGQLPHANADAFDEQAIWLRETTAADILRAYRTYYTPQRHSPLIDVGDPNGGQGNDIGAIGAGQANSADQFGFP